MKYFFIVIIIFMITVLTVVIIGYFLPVKHTASIHVRLNTAPSNVWHKLQDVKRYPEWRKGLRAVELQSSTSWVEVDQKNHRLPLEIVSQETEMVRVIKINGKDLRFGGTWTFNLAANGYDTVITITENGEVYNPFFRFISRFIMGYNASIKAYANDLKTAFNK